MKKMSTHHERDVYLYAFSGFDDLPKRIAGHNMYTLLLFLDLEQFETVAVLDGFLKSFLDYGAKVVWTGGSASEVIHDYVDGIVESSPDSYLKDLDTDSLMTVWLTHNKLDEAVWDAFTVGAYSLPENHVATPLVVAVASNDDRLPELNILLKDLGTTFKNVLDRED